MSCKPPVYQHPELDGKTFTFHGSKYPNCALLFIHGFTATTVEVRLIADFFHMKGFTVSAPLLPGHGQSPHDYKNNNDDSMAWQGYKVVPLRAAASLHDFQQIIKKLLPSIRTDTFIFQGKLDSTINPNSSQLIFDGLSSRRKTLTWLEESRHCILLDKQIDLVQEQCFNELIYAVD